MEAPGYKIYPQHRISWEKVQTPSRASSRERLCVLWVSELDNSGHPISLEPTWFMSPVLDSGKGASLFGVSILSGSGLPLAFTQFYPFGRRMFIFSHCRLELCNLFSCRSVLSLIKDLGLLDSVVAVIDDGNF